MSNLEEENRKLKEENNALKLVVDNFSSRFERYFNDADDKTDDKTKPDYTALLEELEFNDKMAGKETTKEVPNKVPLIYQDFLNELKLNDELLKNTIK